VSEPSASIDGLSTPHIADACLRLGATPRAAPVGLRPVIPGSSVAGPVLPARHYGSVDVFLEALEQASKGDVLVIDDGGRIGAACIGDLVVREAQAAGLAGLVVWGLHRDHSELVQIGLPVFSYGRSPLGPASVERQGPEALISARFGETLVSRDDFVFADDDGAVFVSREQLEAIQVIALSIGETERRQAEMVKSGVSLRAQTRFHEYLELCTEDSTYTFRRHLRRIGGAIEQ
jgi:4-hydroxy-4-methyl-2-oxoglutarate aldolase